MVAFASIKPDDVLWDCHRVRMGNTTMRRMACWKVRILSINEADRSAIVSWNGNPPCRYKERDLKKLRRTKVDGAN